MISDPGKIAGPDLFFLLLLAQPQHHRFIPDPWYNADSAKKTTYADPTLSKMWIRNYKK